MFTEPLLRNGLHNLVVLLLRACMLRALPSNGRCLQSHCLATDLYATVLYKFSLTLWHMRAASWPWSWKSQKTMETIHKADERANRVLWYRNLMKLNTFMGFWTCFGVTMLIFLLWNTSAYGKYALLTVATMKITILWNVTPYISFVGYLTTLSEAKLIKRRMVGWLKNWKGSGTKQS
jgi:hypothetical protein